MAACRSCNADIIWATSAQTGKPMPLDAKPVADGNMVMIRGTVRAATDEDRKLHRDHSQEPLRHMPGRSAMASLIVPMLVFQASHQYAYETELTSMWTHDPYLKNKQIARCGCFADEVSEQIKRWEANGNDLFPREIFAPGGEWPPGDCQRCRPAPMNRCSSA